MFYVEGGIVTYIYISWWCIQAFVHVNLFFKCKKLF